MLSRIRAATRTISTAQRNASVFKLPAKLEDVHRHTHNSIHYIESNERRRRSGRTAYEMRFLPVCVRAHQPQTRVCVCCRRVGLYFTTHITKRAIQHFGAPRAHADSVKRTIAYKMCTTTDKAGLRANCPFVWCVASCVMRLAAGAIVTFPENIIVATQMPRVFVCVPCVYIIHIHICM